MTSNPLPSNALTSKALSSNAILPDVEIRSRRLLLRALRRDDVDDLVVACTDEHTQRWLPLPRPYTRAGALTFVEVVSVQTREQGRGLVRAIHFEDRLAGVIDLKRPDWLAGSVEIGYWTAPWARRRAVMTEAVGALTAWALREQGFQRVEIRVATENVASLRVAERAGFQREGVLRRAGYTHDGPVDLVVLSQLA